MIKRDYASIQEEQKKQVRETYVNEVKSQLDVSFHNLELAQRPGFGAKNAKRSVRKFLTYVDEIDELLINRVIVDACIIPLSPFYHSRKTYIHFIFYINDMPLINFSYIN